MKHIFTAVIFLTLLLSPAVIHILTSTASAQCQPPSARTWIAFSDNGSCRDTLWFGNDGNASYGIDTPLCEIELPPAPPLGTCDVRFVNIPGREGTNTPAGLGRGTKKDYRSNFSVAIDTFKIQFQSSGAGFPVHFSWSVAGILALYDSAWFQDGYGGLLSRIRVPMHVSNNCTFASSQLTSALIIGYRIITDVNEGLESGLPQASSLEQNYPNPFNPNTEIRFKIQAAGFTSLKVYDVLGREVAALVNEKLNPGTYQRQFSGEELSSGVYFYRMQAGEFMQTRKLLLLK